MQPRDRFVTRRSHSLFAAGSESFPVGRTDGLYMHDADSGEAILLSSNVVCIRSAPNDRSGRHNLIPEVTERPTRADPGAFCLPPYAVVTLVSVQDRWRVRRQTMKCRLFTCEVSFDLR